ncbi:PEP-CTERM sorting domain-containing protein [Alteromonas sp. 1_MG-2023]|uniref:PEP-CTERM sorting domain-containing protein n=1 Tax=Alteromonas sp. 1_MG-2023 TaxID=3062669 RepID=UPI0026E3B0D9|nr:PEP-CTERM sorting domain-containing protein [Alteromonas sp. 1_MG-2023]MDO6474831.1 PEP-CTERM sorting domain-containing protein [Alteromonas sp. 1_MG-2023]
MRSLLVFVCSILAASANAGLINYTDEASFLADAGTGLTLIDFDSATGSTTSYTESGVTFATNGTEADAIVIGDYASTGSSQIFSNYFVNNLIITFAGAGINAFGSDIFSLFSGSTLSFELLLSDTTTEVVTVDSADGYFATILDGGNYITQVTVNSLSAQAEGLDNFYFGTVAASTPSTSVTEPATLGVLALGLSGLVGLRRRQR